MATPKSSKSATPVTPKSDETKLSKETMKMKFMKRASDKISSPEVELESPLTDKKIENGDQATVVAKISKWKLPIVIPQPKLSDDKIISIPITPDLKAHTLSRRSFNGFNQAVEKANLEMLSSDSLKASNKKKKIEKTSSTADDEAKTKAYFNRGGGGGGKKNNMNAPNSTGKNKSGGGKKNKEKKSRKSI